jgi:hypothetical protein
MFTWTRATFAGPLVVAVLMLLAGIASTVLALLVDGRA